VKPTSVTVAGGGVVGLCCAHYLRRAGLDVTVLERDRLGSGASRGNAGEVCPDMVTPLGAPGIVGKALLGLPRPDSPLWIHPAPSAELVTFLTRLGLHSTARHFERGTAALAALAAGTFGLFEDLEALGVDGRARKDGYLLLFPSRRPAEEEMAEHRQLGVPISSGLLSAGELAELEPALGPGAQAGYTVDRQWSIDPSHFVDSLADRLRKDGVELVEGARVTAVRARGGRTEVRTTAGTWTADATVIAAGVWSRELCRGLGADVCLMPGKGYSLSVPADPLPSRLLHLGTAKVVLTPLGDRVRAAGTMEFDRDPDRFRQGRVDAIVAAARPYLRGADWDRRESEWMGPRPMTPDGLPFIGPVPGSPGVFLAAGHNMLGLMLAPATGRLVTGLVTGEMDEHAAAPFAVERGSHGLRRRAAQGRR
jgi:D-amino-acid dehydrogenase